jgi:hypothetical protein
MDRLTIVLTDHEAKALQELSDQTGESMADLIRDAIAKLTTENRHVASRQSLQIAKGIWKDRKDLPERRKL